MNFKSPPAAIILTLALCFSACELEPGFEPGQIVGGVLQAKFSFSAPDGNTCYAPCTVTFANSSTGATKYTWNFGDGMSSTEASPSHEFDLGGQYEVILTAEDANGNQQVEMITINIRTPVTFEKTFGDAQDQYAQAMVCTDEEGYAIAGYQKIGSDTDGYLVRLDSSGNAIFGFPKIYGEGSSIEHKFNDLDFTDDGGFIMAGSSNISDGDQILLFRTDNLGNVVPGFPKEFSDPYEGLVLGQDGFAVRQLSDGGFGLIGRSYNYRGGSGQSDALYFRTNPSGEQVNFGFFASDLIWSEEYIGDWIITGSNEFLLVGGTQTNGGSSDEFFIVKSDLSGNAAPSFPVTFGGGGDEKLLGICEDPDGGFAATGYTYSSSAGAEDVYFVKLNTSGEPIVSSQKTFGGVSADQGAAIQPTGDGGFVIVGFTQSFGLGGQDVYLIKVDNNGNELFNQTIGGFGDDYAIDVRVARDGGFLIAATTKSFGSGGSDIYVIKTDAKGRVF